MAMSRKLHILGRAGLLLGLSCNAILAEDRYVIYTKGDVSQIAQRHGLKVVKSLSGSGNGHYVLSGSGKSSQETLRELAADSQISSAETDGAVLLPGQRSGAAVHPSGAPQGQGLPLDGTQAWYYTSLAAKGYLNQPAASVIGVAQSHTVAAGNAKVAVIDTGIDRTNLVLAPSIGDGYDFVHGSPLGQERFDVNQETTPILDQETTPILDQETTPILDGGSAIILSQETTPILDQETTPILDSKKYPAYGHGTMVSGLIHLVAPKAMLLSARAFAADGTSTVSQIVEAIYWAVDHGANVINMSFSTAQNSAALQKAIDEANSRGVICVAAAGNDGQAILVWPAAYSNVIGVGSTNDSDVRSLFSNYGSEVSLAAPGEALITTYPSTNAGLTQHYAEVWGTSFSSPLVAGTAALLVDIDSHMNGAQARNVFGQSSTPIGNQGLGAGELDAYQAVLNASRKNGKDN
jgi:subtilisin family serine protease